MSVDGTPISETDLARIHAEEALHAEQQRKAVRVVASAAADADDCRTLLSMLGLEDDIVMAARQDAPAIVAHAAAKRPRKPRAA